MSAENMSSKVYTHIHSSHIESIDEKNAQHYKVENERRYSHVHK